MEDAEECFVVSEQDLLEKRFEKSDRIVARRISEAFVLVPIHAQSSDIDGFFRLNEVGTEIWELVDRTRTVGEIRDTLVDRFDVQPDVARDDLIEFLNELEKIGAVREIQHGRP